MNNNPRLLTVTQFAKEKGISKPTVLKWIKEGKIEGLISDFEQKHFLIPESNLSIPVRGGVRPRTLSLEWPYSEEEAREIYNKNRDSGNKRKVVFTYDEFKQLLDDGLTYQSMADLAGVSRQAIEQFYSKYFAPFRTSGRDRRKELVKKSREERVVKDFRSLDRLSSLREIMEKEGFVITPIPTKGGSFKSRTTMILVNGKKCGLHKSKIQSRVSHKNSRFYYRIVIGRSILSSTELTILLVGKEDLTTYIIPSKVLLDTFSQYPIRNQKMLYVPVEIKPVYNNHYPDIDWLEWENKWSLLE